jgi:hypothetical protein
VTHRKTIVASIGVVAVLGLAPVSLALASNSSGPHVAESQIDKVEGYASQNYSAIFSSAVATDGETDIVVFLTKQDPAAESAIAAQAAPGVISFDTAPWTKSQILATQSQVVADWNQLDTQGIKVISIFPSINGDGLVHIGVENLTVSEANALNQDFGAAHLSISNVSPANLPQPLIGRTRGAK